MGLGLFLDFLLKIPVFSPGEGENARKGSFSKMNLAPFLSKITVFSVFSAPGFSPLNRFRGFSAFFVSVMPKLGVSGIVGLCAQSFNGTIPTSGLLHLPHVE